MAPNWVVAWGNMYDLFIMICPICQAEFEDHTKGHNKKCCCPEHSRQLYYNKHKDKLNRQKRLEYQQNKPSNCPQFRCQNCGEIMKLDFNPKVSFAQFKNFKCPHCNHKATKAV